MDGAPTSALAAVTLAPAAQLTAQPRFADDGLDTGGGGRASGHPPANPETLAEMQALLAAQNDELVEARAARRHAENVSQAEMDARIDAQKAAEAAEKATKAAENATKAAENATKAAEKATESERDARITAEKAMEAERDARLAAESQALLRPGVAGPSGAPYEDDVVRVPGVGSVRITPESLALPSWAAQAQSILAPKRGMLLAHPVSVPRPSGAVGDAFRRLLDIVVADEQPPARALMSQDPFYDVAMSILPPFATVVGTSTSAMDSTALFSVAGTCTRAWSFSEQCQPDLNVRGTMRKAPITCLVSTAGSRRQEVCAGWSRPCTPP